MDSNAFIYEDEEVDVDSYFYNDYVEESDETDPIFETLNNPSVMEDIYETSEEHNFLNIDEISSEERLKEFPGSYILPSRIHSATPVPNVANPFDCSRMPNLDHDLRKTMRTIEFVAKKNNLFDEVATPSEQLGESSIENATPTQIKSSLLSDGLLCSQCNNCFRTRGLFNRHAPNCLKSYLPHHLLCPYETCPIRCDCMATIIQHVRDYHKRDDLNYETFKFDNFDEYYRWKDAIENALGARFIYSSGRTNLNGKIMRRVCSYSKKFIKLNDSKPRCRIRSTKKNGRTCTAFYICEEHVGGTLTVHGCFKHIGHENSIRDGPLTTFIRRDIATYLLRGLSDIEICEIMKKSSDPSDRRYYIQPYEVRNVLRKLDRQNEKSICSITQENKSPTENDTMMLLSSDIKDKDVKTEIDIEEVENHS